MTILQMGQGSDILSFTDSSIALGWMQKSSFNKVNAESHNALSHWLGWTLVSNETAVYSQHIKGTENIIADSLSWDLIRSDQTLTKNFNKILPPQTAALFHIKQPPRNDISWVSLIAADSIIPTELPKTLQPSSTETGIGGAY